MTMRSDYFILQAVLDSKWVVDIQWCGRGRFHKTETDAEAELTRPSRAEARPNVRGRGKALEKNQESNLSYRQNSAATENNVNFYTDYVWPIRKY